jgi:hypothetical protein
MFRGGQRRSGEVPGPAPHHRLTGVVLLCRVLPLPALVRERGGEDQRPLRRRNVQDQRPGDLFADSYPVRKLLGVGQATKRRPGIQITVRQTSPATSPAASSSPARTRWRPRRR